MGRNNRYCGCTWQPGDYLCAECRAKLRRFRHWINDQLVAAGKR